MTADRFEKILYVTFPSIKNSNLTNYGKVDMYNHYLREAVIYVKNPYDFQRLSKAYNECIDIKVKMDYK